MKILVADDHQLIANGVISYYQSNFPSYFVTSAKNKSELVYQLNDQSFDILIQDLQFGKDDGRELLQLVKNIQPEIKTLILSSHIDEFSVKSAMAVGYNAYLSKGAPISEIQVAIEHILKKETYFSTDIRDKFANGSLKNSTAENEIVLTDREKEVLFGIQAELSTKEIAQKIHLSDKTVEAYRANLFMKFGVKNVAGLVKQSILKGYMNGGE